MDSGTTDTDGRVIIGGERASLSLAIADERGGVARGRPFQVDWLTGTADLRLGEVQVSRPIAARPDDLMCFAAELDDCVTLLLGSASFASLDDGLLIDITMGTLGHALVTGIVRFEVGEAQGDLFGWVLEGKVRHQVHVVKGLERAPEALNLLFTGGNTGKVIVEL